MTLVQRCMLSFMPTQKHMRQINTTNEDCIPDYDWSLSWEKLCFPQVNSLCVYKALSFYFSEKLMSRFWMLRPGSLMLPKVTKGACQSRITTDSVCLQWQKLSFPASHGGTPLALRRWKQVNQKFKASLVLNNMTKKKKKTSFIWRSGVSKSSVWCHEQLL